MGFIVKCIAVSAVLLLSVVEGAPRQKRDLLQLVSELHKMTNRSGLDFNNYGCYCGWGGTGKPIDGVDACCKDHDACYGKVGNCYPKWIPYDYREIGTNESRILECQDKKTTCYYETCTCDVTLATCVSKFIYHPEYKDMKQLTCYEKRR